MYLTAGTLDCTGALDGWTITSPTARACAPDDDLLVLLLAGWLWAVALTWWTTRGRGRYPR